MTAIKLVYIANIIVAGWIGITSLFYPKLSSETIFQNSYQTTDIIRLVGWLPVVSNCSPIGIRTLEALGIFAGIIVATYLQRFLAFGSCLSCNEE